MDKWEALQRKHDYQPMSPEVSGIRTEISLREFRENLLYVHTPKTGGTTMNKDVQKQMPGGWTECGHVLAHSWRNNRSCFSTVRNPFDWLISMWFFNWGHHNSSARPVQSVWPNIKTFLYEFNSFDKNRGGKEWNENPGSRKPAFSFRHLQTCQTWDILNAPGEKHSFAEFYIRLERLEEALSQWNISKIRKLNRGPSRPAGRNYRDFYDTKLIDHITAHRKQELDLLGYDFEGPTDDLAVFKVNKPFVWK